MKLEVKNIRKSFGEKEVLHGVSFQVEGGKALGLLGRNGAGKTTTIRILMDVFHANSGEILLDGKKFVPSMHQIGYLPEERGLYPKRKVIDQMVYLAELRGMGAREARESARKKLARLEISEHENKKLETLSKGNQQKIQFMTALLPDPDLLILDEPLSGLDPVNTDLFKGIIRDEIAKGKYLIMSSHQMATVEEFCTDIIILNRSKTVLAGHLNDIKKSYGRINLLLKTETDVTDLIRQEGLTLVSAKETEYQIKVSGDEQANGFLKLLIENGVTVVTFSLREPSLHEIFVEKVGDAHEA